MPKKKKRKASLFETAKMAYHGKNYTAAQKAAEEKRKRKERERAEREKLKSQPSILKQSRTNKINTQLGNNRADVEKVFGKK